MLGAKNPLDGIDNPCRSVVSQKAKYGLGVISLADLKRGFR